MHFLKFYRAAWNAARSSDENSVCPSVHLSVTRVNCDKTVERCVQISHHTKDHSV